MEDVLGSSWQLPKEDEKVQPLWSDKMVDLLAKLLQEMGKSLGYEFDEVHIKKAYTPQRHTQELKMKIIY
ncbi:DUF6680 family protein [Candidatus Reidiella endopervernicosa]|uniref:DUF6680 family protein n=1 Tax=Candidatus Reidiella endopervernicosa TaxID=2738883 RepID=UPI003B967CFB